MRKWLEENIPHAKKTKHLNTIHIIEIIIFVSIQRENHQNTYQNTYKGREKKPV